MTIGKITTISFDNRYSILAVGTGSSLIYIYNVISGHCTAILTHAGELTSLDFNDGGYNLISAATDLYEGTTIRLWDIHPVQTITTEYLIALKTTFIGAPDPVSRPYDESNLAASTSLYQAHEKRISCIKFAPEPIEGCKGYFRTLIASGSEDRTIKLWDYSVQNCVEMYTSTMHSKPVNSMCFSSDGVVLFSTSEAELIVFKIITISFEKARSRDSGQVFSMVPIFRQELDNIQSMTCLPQSSASPSYRILIASDSAVSLHLMQVEGGTVDNQNDTTLSSWYAEAMEQKENRKNNQFTAVDVDLAFDITMTECNKEKAKVTKLTSMKTFIKAGDWPSIPISNCDERISVFVSGDDKGNVILWAVDSSYNILQVNLAQMHTDAVTDLCFINTSFSPGIHFSIATSSLDESVAVFEMQNPEFVQRRIQRQLSESNKQHYSNLLSENNRLKHALDQ